MRVEIFSFDISDIVEKGVQTAPGRLFRVEIAQGSCGGVPRIFQRFIRFFIVFFECAELHNCLALHLHFSCKRYIHRYRFYRSRLRQNALAHLAVSARGSLHKPVVVICQIYGQSVEFIF